MRCFLSAAALLAVSASGSALAVSPTLLYSGRAFDAAGAPVSGALEMRFRIFDQEQDGTLLFEESFVGGDAVGTTQGYFTVLLQNNEASSLTLDEVAALYSTLYIELVINDAILEPRQLTAPVPWALAGGNASGSGLG